MPDITLTIEQLFRLQQFKLELEAAGKEPEDQNMILELSRQLMIKDNIILQLVNKCAAGGCL